MVIYNVPESEAKDPSNSLVNAVTVTEELGIIPQFSTGEDCMYRQSYLLIRNDCLEHNLQTSQKIIAKNS